MSHLKLEEKVENLLKPIIDDLAYILYDVQYEKQGKDYYLRITIDKPEGITLEDCEKVHHAIDAILDEADYIPNAYFLEVSSPGLERILRKDWHFESQIGNSIQVNLYKAMDKQKQYQGKLVQYQKDELLLEVDGNLKKIEKKNLALAKTVADFFEKGKE